MPGSSALDGDPVPRKPGGEGDAACLLPRRRLVPGEEPREALDPLQRNDLDHRWNREGL